MLVLTRKAGETIWIGEDVEIIISEVKGEQVKIAINAPRSIEIIRGELRQDISASNTEAAKGNLDLLKKKIMVNRAHQYAISRNLRNRSNTFDSWVFFIDY
ncbi:carbon storage regulator CsrA [Lysinibacillus boronitolerans]|uniref:carbon storage regulator CsrA n=1 Tax=Lysinibacillus boronitolerans TaxID=309788 RepID=UPI0002E75F6C|nr:carbon storage regulator CsrA [Lysinibacillus boronitolerans]